MTERCLCSDFELRGRTYEIWPDSLNSSNRCLVDPRTRTVVDTDHAFDPPLSNDELLTIYYRLPYGRERQPRSTHFPPAVAGAPRIKISSCRTRSSTLFT